MNGMFGKQALNHISLMSEAAALYTQLKQTNNWEGQLHPCDLDIAL